MTNEIKTGDKVMVIKSDYASMIGLTGTVLYTTKLRAVFLAEDTIKYRMRKEYLAKQ